MKTAGVLCPVFSLPGAYGIGDFGPSAYEFLDILHHADVDIWQVLPLNPLGYGHSPYQPLSSFAGETSFIDLRALYRDGLLTELPAPLNQCDRVNYENVAAFKAPYFRKAFASFKRRKTPEAYTAFIREDWVKPYAVFAALKRKNGNRSWLEWPEEEKHGVDFSELDEDTRQDAELEMFLQYEFRIQWLRIRDYAKEKRIRIMGDIPIYVGSDSLDVYGDREQFLLDPDGYPTSVAGVPPDYFSETGQRWGNPIYDWEHMKADGFRFWRERMKGTAKLFDMIRIDHFLAFSAYWKIPASSPTAKVGEWVPAPGYEVFDAVLPEIPGTEIVCEDLGLVTDKVHALRDHYGFPGMNIVQFTINDPDFKTRPNMISYTGTHDNDTIETCYKNLNDFYRERFDGKLREAGIDLTKGTKAEQVIEYVFGLPTDTCIIPVADILSLGDEGRINCPGIVDEVNWTCKLRDFSALKKQAGTFKKMIREGKKKAHGDHQTV